MSTRRNNINDALREDPYQDPSGIFMVGTGSNAEYWFVGEGEVPYFVKHSGTPIFSGDKRQPNTPLTPPHGSDSVRAMCADIPQPAGFRRIERDLIEQSTHGTSGKPRDNVDEKVCV